MPRKARIDAPGAIHHIIARGIERGIIFRDDQDRDDFVHRLGKVVTETETRCFAWALIPNHFHLLLQTGAAPVSTVMRRLLTGYAVGHNRRHDRSGHLFQNRYKSILCQKDAYLKELVRYIHLNPLRAGLVENMDELDRYRFSGHSYVAGKMSNDWQAVSEVLSIFDDRLARARLGYRNYLIQGITLGRQPDLVGGGLVRSAGGWDVVCAMRRVGDFQKSDERILGDGDFVETVLVEAQEQMRLQYVLASKGIEFKDLADAVSKVVPISLEELVGPSKARRVVKARAIICYWAVRELGMSMTEIGEKLKIAVSTVSAAVNKGQSIAKEEGLVLSELLNMEI
ncbi:helix-turn-helix domain-containing protein [Desulfatitalea tepidiphila]|uniref:helix-turn-helix domain-containing protein n=1 Tax=Desulfatitalea tepidiphila TaxID=1185843 RepID=UPI000978471E|nr:helix-turn-helix domain-containing protein [Desulfatitalea tepidiphila]